MSTSSSASRSSSGRVGAAAVFLGEGRGPGRVEIGRRDQPDLRVGRGRRARSRRRCCRSDDADAEGVMPRGYDIRACATPIADAYRQRDATRPDRAPALHGPARSRRPTSPGTLRAVAAAGYRAVELAGLPETAPGELAPAPRRDRPARRRGARGHRDAFARTRGRRGPAGRARLPAGRSSRGCPRRTGRPPTTSGASPPSSAASRRTLRGRGIRLGYHNHAFEFAPLDGTTIWDVLLARAAGRGRARARRLLGGRRRPRSRWPRSAATPVACGCST